MVDRSKKITFKEYLDYSKEQLEEALNKTPKRTVQYNIRKYSKLTIGESKQDKKMIPLKPKQKLFVDLLYENVDNPTIRGIRFEGVKDIDPNDNYKTYWEGKKLLEWLNKNAIQEN